MSVFKVICLAVATSALTGCAVGIANEVMFDAYASTETPENSGEAPANYRGKDCVALAVERGVQERLVADSDDYVRKHANWALASIQQVERESGCMPGITSLQAAMVDQVLKHPESLKELESQLPPGGLEYIKARGNPLQMPHLWPPSLL
ncbi:hypothetical protein [Pseudomonas sp. Gutcm_11s]|uniref:hypothetical protein n=1 Tax=Pseudomonas sp. Gutcm_11s TaxID=3026088 RepID=UPI00236278C9|nr:hypothetical protein [Pseudomonas sp. Gutcm_11s]MDD0843168.1 hypothetical protein [Pseudomonas sp. Gutcm_11s]